MSTLTLHRLTGRTRYARAGFFQPATLRVSVNVDESDRTAFLATTLHERIHYLQTTGTTYGNFVGLGRHIQSLVVYECLKELIHRFGSDNTFRLWLTLRDWRSDLVDGAKASIISKHLTASDVMEALISGFENIVQSPSLDLAIRARSYSKAVRSPRTTVCPDIGSDDSKFAFGGLAIEEAFAQFWQLHMEAQLEKQFPDTNFLDACLPQIGSQYYSAAIRLCRDKLGPAGYDAFPIVSDLALMGPYHLLSPSSSSVSTYLWEDIHPGWRFVRALDAIKLSDLMGRVDVAHFDSEEGYAALTSAICANLRWPTPSELCDHALSDQGHGWVELGGRVPTVNAFETQFRRTWQTRQKFPASFAFPWHFLTQLSACDPPLVFGSQGLMKVGAEHGDMFLSILVQDIVANGFLERPVDESGKLQAARLDCPGKILGGEFECGDCQGSFPRAAPVPMDCWFANTFEQAFGVPIGKVASVW